MKTLKLLLLGIVLILAGAAEAQISVNVNVGAPPSWGPSGYNDVRYYYLPDVESYYDVRNSTFIYISGDRWVRSAYLPRQYRNYDLNRGYKVVMHDYRGSTPYTYYHVHRKSYSKGYKGNGNKNYGEWNEKAYKSNNSNKAFIKSSHNNSYSNQPVIKMEQKHDNKNYKGNSHGNDKHDKGGQNKGKH